MPEAEQVEVADQLLKARLAAEAGHFQQPEDIEAAARDAPGLPLALGDPSGPDEGRVERAEAGFDIGHFDSPIRLYATITIGETESIAPLRIALRAGSHRRGLDRPHSLANYWFRANKRRVPTCGRVRRSAHPTAFLWQTGGR